MTKKGVRSDRADLQTPPHGKSIHTTGAVLLTSLSLFYVLVCTPVYLISVTNVLISETVFPQIWDLFQNLLLFLNFWIVSAWMAVICVKNGFHHIWTLCAWFILSSAIRFFGSVSISTRILESSDLAADYLNALQDCLLEWIPLGILIGILWLCLGKKGKQTSQEELPPKKVFPLDTRIKSTLFGLASVPALIHLLTRIRYDIFIGIPKQRIDLIEMILFYLADLACWLIGYLLIFFFVNRLTKKKNPEKEKNKDL